VQPYRPGALRKGFNLIASAVAGAGLPVGVWRLATQGRRTGLRRTTPVRLVSLDGKRWLVAPYGHVAWVHNARATGEVEVARGRRRERCRIREASVVESGRVLQRYVRLAPVVLPYFEAGLLSPPEAFEREAGDHPVFELLPLE